MEIIQTYNIYGDSITYAEELLVTKNGKCYVGGEDINIGNGILCTCNNFLMEGILQINKYGTFLNEKGNISTTGKINNNGIFINQGVIKLDNNTVLNCKEFDTENRGGILNLSKYKTKYNLNIDKKKIEIDTNIMQEDAKIICIPGCQINSNGIINGGIVDLTQYLQINNNNIDANDNSNTLLGQKLIVKIKNANILLFSDISERILVKNNITNIFSNITFNNCIAYIPSGCGGDGSYLAETFYKSNILDSFENQKLSNENKLISVDGNIHKIYNNSFDSNNNFSIVKLLFNSKEKLYHNMKLNDIGNTLEDINNEGLNLINNDSNIVTSKQLSFSDLFNKYINCNCYIDLNDCQDKLLPKDNKDVSKITLDRKEKYKNSIYKYSLYIQLSNNNGIQEISKYNGIGNGEFDKPLRLIIYNPWCYYNGSICRELPIKNKKTQIYQKYDGKAFTCYKITFDNESQDDNTKPNLPNSEKLEYVIDCSCSNFYSDKELVVDKFTISDGCNVICNTDITTSIYRLKKNASHFINNKCLTIMGSGLRKKDFKNSSRTLE